MPLGFYIGMRVKSRINFESPEGVSVFEGTVGIVTGPGVPTQDDITVDFPGVENVGLRLNHIEEIEDPEPDALDGDESVTKGDTNSISNVQSPGEGLNADVNAKPARSMPRFAFGLM